jgi:pimeloyl-ACP methyl ester carboxylesterase
MQKVEARDGRMIAVESLGDPDGAPVFLMHGTPGSFAGPHPRGIFLRRRGIRLISYNRPGYADSDRLPCRRVADAADDVEDIADYFGIVRFSVIGRSGGAPHALACAAQPRLRHRVICAAALGSLAPVNAAGLMWADGMVESNVKAYRDAEDNLPALIATLSEHVQKIRDGSQGPLRFLGPELENSDSAVLGDIALRKMIATTNAIAVRDGIDGWVDDMLALGSQNGWGIDLEEITAPVLLWHGANDKFSPIGHARWLGAHIPGVKLQVKYEVAHFDSVTILPQILTWVLDQVSADRFPLA